MLNEIDGDFYCSAGCYVNNYCFAGHRECSRERCLNCHRKHPTPKQYEGEYGQGVPDSMPVWYRICKDGIWLAWAVDMYRSSTIAALRTKFDVQIACACTPYGKPNDKWRPE